MAFLSLVAELCDDVVGQQGDRRVDPELFVVIKPRLTAMREAELVKHQATTELLRREDIRSGPKPGRRALG